MAKTDSVFKIFTPSEWAAFSASSVFKGSPLDIADGYIHLSAAPEMQGTLDKWYTSGDNVIIAEIDMARIKDSVKWEVSRGGAKFPHQYGALTMDDILSQNVLTRNAKGRYEFDTK